MKLINEKVSLTPEDIKAILESMEIEGREGRAEYTFGDMTLTMSAGFEYTYTVGGTSDYMGMLFEERLVDRCFWTHEMAVEVYTEDGGQYCIDYPSWLALEIELKKREW